MNKNLKMNAKIEFTFTQPIADQEELGFDLGTIEFVIDQKFVPLEFDRIDSKCGFQGNTIVAEIEAGYLQNNYKESARSEQEKAIKIEEPTTLDNTSKSISKATQINIFDIWPTIDDEEVDADEFKMTILKLTFTDNFGSHSVAQEPIEAFNEVFNKL